MINNMLSRLILGLPYPTDVHATGSNVYLVGNGTERLLIDTGKEKHIYVCTYIIAYAPLAYMSVVSMPGGPHVCRIDARWPTCFSADVLS